MSAALKAAKEKERAEREAKQAALLRARNGYGAIVEPEPQVFRGFLSGSAFVTKKGFRGNKVDSMWARYIFLSFETDDVDLAKVGLSSSLADLNATVIGGEFGTPFSIGEWGFYTKKQFEDHAEYLQKTERKNAKGSQFLSVAEWKLVDDKLSELASYSEWTFSRAAKGDSFAALAVRKNAFLVAAAFMDAGLDPLVENEEGNDVFEILKQQYKDMSVLLLEIQREADRASEMILLPSEEADIEQRDNKIVQAFKDMTDFCNAFTVNLTRRLDLIEEDKIAYRKAELKRSLKDFPKDRLRSISFEPKVKKHLEEIADLVQNIKDKLHHHVELQKNRVSLSKVMAKQYRIALEGEKAELDEKQKKVLLNATNRKGGTLSREQFEEMMGKSKTNDKSESGEEIWSKRDKDDDDDEEDSDGDSDAGGGGWWW